MSRITKAHIAEKLSVTAQPIAISRLIGAFFRTGMCRCGMIVSLETARALRDHRYRPGVANKRAVSA
jgi:hypothetical protein